MTPDSNPPNRIESEDLQVVKKLISYIQKPPGDTDWQREHNKKTNLKVAREILANNSLKDSEAIRLLEAEVAKYERSKGAEDN